MSRIFVSALSAVVLGACVGAPVEVPAPVAGPQPVIAGGYAPADVNSPGYKEAEALAIAEVYRREPQRGLVEQKSAQVQVVAGLNYMFDIKMTGVNRYRVVVYRDLQGQLSVTGFARFDEK